MFLIDLEHFSHLVGGIIVWYCTGEATYSQHSNNWPQCWHCIYTYLLWPKTLCQCWSSINVEMYVGWANKASSNRIIQVFLKLYCIINNQLYVINLMEVVFFYHIIAYYTCTILHLHQAPRIQGVKAVDTIEKKHKNKNKK